MIYGMSAPVNALLSSWATLYDVDGVVKRHVECTS